MAVYLLHFERKIHHAQHYLGSSNNLDERIAAHQRGAGARLVQVFTEDEIGFILARTWPDGDRVLERALKRRKNGPRLCPICNPHLRVSKS